jgi:uncharacterized protein (TIGR03083 family)
MTTTVPWPEVRADFERAVERLATMTAAADGDRLVTGTDWTIHNTVVHITTVLDRWVGTAHGSTVEVARGRDFAGRMAEINQREIDAAPGDPAALARAAGRWLDVAADPDATMHAYGTAEAQCTFTEATGTMLGEVMVHGFDIARTLHQPWPIPRRAGIAVFEGILPIVPLVYDGSATRGKEFDIDIRLRGRDSGIGFHCTPDALTISDGSLTGAPIHISADPGAWLLVGYGRQSQMSAALTGKIVAWGRKPWLATKFGQLVQPV